MLAGLFGASGRMTMHPGGRARIVLATGAPPPSLSVGVIGGGIAGVTAARALAEHGVKVTLHEREAMLGGRLGAVDDGSGACVGAACSYIHPKNPEFKDQCQAWAKDGLMAVWSEANPHLIASPGAWSPLSSKADSETWYVGTPHMASICSDTTGIDVRQGDIFDINYDAQSQRWVVASQPPLPLPEDGTAADGAEARWPSEATFHSAIVLALPVHEAAELLDRKTLDKMLGRGRYKDFVKERVSAIVRFERSLELPFGFAVMTAEGAVAISDTSRRRA